MKMKKKTTAGLLLTLALLFSLFSSTACGQFSAETLSGDQSQEGASKIVSMEEIPDYSGKPYCEVNGNVPEFAEEDMTGEAFETYSSLDNLQRCGEAYAEIGTELMPLEERGSIGQVKPTGWHTVKYDFVDGKYLYNRCHLIGYQLSGENANEENLITGTRYMNVEGMLPFENMVADYVKETGNHVMYRVVPVFEGNDLVARGVQMEALSVEDEGEGICFNVFVYNVQPGVEIDYSDGSSRASSEQESDSEDGSEKMEIRGNKRSKIYHMPGQRDYDLMEDSPNLVIFHTEDEAKEAGYRKAKQ